MFFRKRNKIRELEEKLEECNDIIETLKEKVSEKSDYAEALKDEIQEKVKDIKSQQDKIKFLENENCKGLSETKKIVKKLEAKEQSRKKLACEKGGYTLYIKRLNKQKDDLEMLIRKKELDYLFALKIIFRKSKLTGDTKAFLGQRLKELQGKFESNRGDNSASNIRYKENNKEC